MLSLFDVEYFSHLTWGQIKRSEHVEHFPTFNHSMFSHSTLGHSMFNLRYSVP
jgi:hypothetical protein